MKTLTYTNFDTGNYPVALLIKSAAFVEHQITDTYVEPLNAAGVDKYGILAVGLEYGSNNKVTAAGMKKQLSVILPALQARETKYLYCADANYFKVLTKSKKADPHLGYRLPCAIEGFDDMEVILGVNHTSLVYNPANEGRLLLSLQTLISVVNDTYTGLGTDIIKNAYYPRTIKEIEDALSDLHQYDTLAADVETFSLRFEEAGIGTINFSWNDNSGVSFPCDYAPYDDAFVGPIPNGHYGRFVPNPEVRAALKYFLEAYQGRLRWHNASFDLKILIATLWMDDLLDTKGLLTGLDILTAKFDCTKIIAYLATNSCAGNKLSLKDLAHEFAGNWAQSDIKDIRRIPLDKLLEYNLVDGLACNWVYNQYYPKMVADKQEEIYESLMLPSQKMLLQTELTGMPMDPKQIPVAKARLKVIIDQQKRTLTQSPVIQRFNTRLQHEAMIAKNALLKTKQHPLSHFSKVTFNPGSGPQKIKLIYEEMGLPILHKTKSKQPSTKSKHLGMLLNHTQDLNYREVLEALTTFTAAEKILTSFIPAFERALNKGGGVVYLHGSFNIGGTVSGRLSSSDPNLQNLPSGSEYGKLMKSCFMAPPGQIMVGADFNSLEDYISALTTEDPNKLKVYLDGYDGHSLRAYAYFKDELPGIVNTVDSINSIATKFDPIRNKSKPVTFLLTYGGTHIGLMKQLGFSKEEALAIDANYHELYAVSDKWVQSKLEEASKTGYVEVAFGLRLRCPLLSQTIRGHSTTPFEAEAEGRTAGNALGQSYGLLNNRAAVDFMQKVWNSPYRLDIKPIALIHDAIYLIVPDRLEVVQWVNRELIKSMSWQELPEIQHDTVKLGAELCLYWPNWSNEIKVPNNCTDDQLRELVEKATTDQVRSVDDGVQHEKAA
jgi:DNA polymerase-1